MCRHISVLVETTTSISLFSVFDSFRPQFEYHGYVSIKADSVLIYLSLMLIRD